MLQVPGASYINQVLTPPAYKLLNLFIKKVKLINFPNIHFPIFHLYFLHIIKFPFKILTFYFRTIHFILPSNKSCFPAGKYWSPKDPIWPSRGRPDLTFWGRPNLTFSGRPLEDFESTQTWMSKILLNFSFRTYSIGQI